jgi:CheY-like chemotaxis protein
MAMDMGEMTPYSLVGWQNWPGPHHALTLRQPPTGYAVGGRRPALRASLAAADAVGDESRRGGLLRVLFVDDEPGQLDELRRLAGQGQDWDASYAAGADEALAAMAEAPVDVLVADLDMPGMDGAELLAETRERHPQTVRILRSSRPDDAVAVRAVPVAHQVVGKPTDGPALAAAIGRAMALRELLGRDALREAVGQVDRCRARRAPGWR